MRRGRGNSRVQPTHVRVVPPLPLVEPVDLKAELWSAQAELSRVKGDLADVCELLRELAEHDRRGYGRWTQGMRKRVERAIS